MSQRILHVCLTTSIPVKIIRWKVREGILLSARQAIFVYTENLHEVDDKKLNFKSIHAGKIKRIIPKEGDIINPGDVILEIEECLHSTVMRDMCAECGADLRNQENANMNASVPIVHSIPELKVSQERAEIIGRADKDRLIESRKLVLLVDLDQTLVHTTNDNVPVDLKDVYHFQLHGKMSPWHHTRIRPRTREFLEEISNFYELHICTFGARNYAHMIACFLDPDGIYFSERILSRDECFSSNSKTANLKALFPCGDELVCIIDDREDVWNFASNLIHVKPYHFFRHTGDINAPPGLTKNENDEKEGFDFTNFDEMQSGDLEPENFQEKVENTSCDSNIEVHPDPNTKSDEATCAVQNMQSVKNLCDREGKNFVENMENQVSETCLNDEDEKTNDSTENKPLNPDVINTTNSDATIANKELRISDKESEKPETVINICDGKQNKDQTKEIGKIKNDSDNLIDIPDFDDYLTHLEGILKNIHNVYYKEYDAMKLKPGSTTLPDLKYIIPRVKGDVLSHCHLVFSGMIPIHKPIKQSRAYMVATSLGATVLEEVSSSCTHLVAARPGTAKVNSARRFKGIHVVTPLWLWHCAERWKKVDEKQYPLGREVASFRHPPPHCGSPERNVMEENDPIPPCPSNDSGERFRDTINPLLTLSSEDRLQMNQEVAALFKDEDDDFESNTVSSDSSDCCDADDDIPGETNDTDDETLDDFDTEEETDNKNSDSDDSQKRRGETQSEVDADTSSSTSSEESLWSEENLKGWSNIKDISRKRKADTVIGTDSEEEVPRTVKCRPSAPLPFDPDNKDSEDEDGQCKLMGQALAKQLTNN